MNESYVDAHGRAATTWQRLKANSVYIAAKQFNVRTYVIGLEKGSPSLLAPDHTLPVRRELSANLAEYASGEARRFA